MKFLMLCLLSVHTAALSDNVLTRAQQSAFVPNFEIRYSFKHDHAQAIWAVLAWDFDECLGPGKVLAALQIKRLEREKQLLIHHGEDLDTDDLPTID